MRTYDAHQTRHLLADWPQKVAHALGAPNLTRALPPGAITLIELVDAGRIERDPWLTAVVPAVTELLRSGSPVLYVESGGPEPGGPAARYLDEFCADALLRTHLDGGRKPSASAVACGRDGCPDGLGPCDRCCVPTLMAIREELETHDYVYGPSIVFLDQVETMRPYWEMTQSTAARNTRDVAQTCARHAEDLLAFAQARTTATVIVSASQTLTGAPQALRAVARRRLVVSNSLDDLRGQVVVHHRASLSEGWQAATVKTAMHLPASRYEWRGGY